jgi:hypothetical protein
LILLHFLCYSTNSQNLGNVGKLSEQLATKSNEELILKDEVAALKAELATKEQLRTSAEHKITNLNTQLKTAEQAALEKIRASEVRNRNHLSRSA